MNGYVAPIDPRAPILAVDKFTPTVTGTAAYIKHYFHPQYQAAQIIGSFWAQNENVIEGGYSSNWAYSAAIDAPYITHSQTLHNNMTQATPANVKGSIARAQLYAQIRIDQQKLPGAP